MKGVFCQGVQCSYSQMKFPGLSKFSNTSPNSDQTRFWNLHKSARMIHIMMRMEHLLHSSLGSPFCRRLSPCEVGSNIDRIPSRSVNFDTFDTAYLKSFSKTSSLPKIVHSSQSISRRTTSWLLCQWSHRQSAGVGTTNYVEEQKVHKEDKEGNIVKIVRDRYLRDDIKWQPAHSLPLFVLLGAEVAWILSVVRRMTDWAPILSVTWWWIPT